MSPTWLINMLIINCKMIHRGVTAKGS